MRTRFFGLEEITQRSTPDDAHRVRGHAGQVGEEVVDRNNRWVLQLRAHLSLGYEHRRELRLGIRSQGLARYAATKQSIRYLVDDAHPAGAETRDDHVSFGIGGGRSTDKRMDGDRRGGWLGVVHGVQCSELRVAAQQSVRVPRLRLGVLALCAARAAEAGWSPPFDGRDGTTRNVARPCVARRG